MGGAERVFIEQAKALIERGYRCTLLVFDLEDRIRPLLPDGAELIVLGQRRYDDVAFLPKLWKLAGCLRRVRPDCVIAHQSLHDYLRWALVGTGIPYFLLKYESMFHLAYDTTKYSLVFRRGFHKVRGSAAYYVSHVPAHWRAGLKRRLVNESYALRDWLGTRGADQVFTMTSRSRSEIQELYRIDPIPWNPGSAHAARPDPPDDDAVSLLRERYDVKNGQPVVLSVNRLEYRKRVDVLVEAFRVLIERGSDAKLVIVGQGDERGNLERQVRDGGLEGAVRFAGVVEEESLSTHYWMCDVAVAINWGSLTLSMVEPLVYNKKTVLSNELPELLEGVPNIFRAKPEPAAVARAIEQALGAEAGDSYSILKGQLDWHGQNDLLLDHIRRAAGRGGARPGA